MTSLHHARYNDHLLYSLPVSLALRCYLLEGGTKRDGDKRENTTETQRVCMYMNELWMIEQVRPWFKLLVQSFPNTHLLQIASTTCILHPGTFTSRYVCVHMVMCACLRARVNGSTLTTCPYHHPLPFPPSPPTRCPR